MPTKQSCGYCGSSHPPRQCPACGKKFTESSKVNHFREECKSVKSRKINDLEQETDISRKKIILIVNVNSINFNSKHLVITANLKTLLKQFRRIIPYKIHTSSDGNIIPLQIYNIYFLGQQKNNWQQQEIKMSN